ncbi:MAG: hypothetical protein HKN18_12210 [Silicimonas sp.]|nr:hypothetical protein [Silicimonas sp.]
MSLPKILQHFCFREDGALTAFGLLLTVVMLCVGGLAIDVANTIQVRTHLQVAADSAAHAALVAREYKTATESKDIAVAVAQKALPSGKFGSTIQPSDIQFGTWDSANEVFTVDPNSDAAVLVNTQRLQARSNGVTTFFFRFVGLDNIDIVRQSVFETYYPTCFREGFVAENRVDVQSNNTYGNGFCIHSNDHVEINNGNTFMDGTIVSMPDKADLVIPTGGMGSNPGLSSALRSGSYRMRILARIDDIISYVDDPTSPYFRSDYVDINPLTGLPAPRITLDRKNKLDNSYWVSGSIHEVYCNAPNQKVMVPSNEILTKGVLITNCKIDFGANSEIRDVIMVNTSTRDDSFSGAAGFTLGLDDGCATGGGAQLVTMGGMSFPSNLQIYGGQMIAAKTISFAARPDGIEGVSIVSGDQIDGTSLINVGFCGGAGMDNNFMAEYFRLAT